jgi:hypothetical protein
MGQFRNRILEIKQLKASELLNNDGNWRLHPDVQRESLVGVLTEVGKADILKAYRSARAGGQLVLYDGHLRKDIDPDEVWTVAITDLTDAEADKMLLLGDPIAAMAELNAAKVLELTDRTMTDNLAVREMMRRMELDAQHVAENAEDEAAPEKPEKQGPAAMELMPFEHYDYVLLFFSNELDWLAAIDVLGLERRSDQRKTHKIGLARCIKGKPVVERLQKAEFAAAQAAAGKPNPAPTTPPPPLTEGAPDADRHPEPETV